VAPLEVEILNTEEVAALFGMKRTTVADYARRGVLPSFKIGKHRRYRRSDIEAWLEEQSRPNPFR
jgi:excisionase family DNA binding protein